jgi:hypothetical protein
MKPLLGVAATGVIALLVWKLLLGLALPFLGIALGFVFLVIKFVFIAVTICIAVWLFRRLGRREEKTA